MNAAAEGGGPAPALGRCLVSDTNEKPPEETHGKFARRDAETQMVLGGFITFIAVPVLIGTIWADTFRAQVVNVAAGLVLLSIGVGIALYGLKKRRAL